MRVTILKWKGSHEKPQLERRRFVGDRIKVLFLFRFVKFREGKKLGSNELEAGCLKVITSKVMTLFCFVKFGEEEKY